MRPLLVLGMHRSGTSLATSLLASAGLHVGDRLLGANPTNPRGHFEDEDFVDFERAALRRLGMNDDGWVVSDPPAIPDDLVARGRVLLDGKQRTRDTWGWKDPRTVPLLPLWRLLLPEARFAIVYRAPWEVVESLFRRGDPMFDDDPELALRVWTYYNEQLLELALAEPGRCVVCSVESLVADPASWVAHVGERLGLALEAPTAGIVEPALLHGDDARARAGMVCESYPEVAALYARLEALAWRPAGADPVVRPPTDTSPDAARRLAMRDWAAAAWATRERRRRAPTAITASVAGASAGRCACCRQQVTFVETGPWLRDQFLCPACRSIPRFRAVNHTLDSYFPGWEQLAVLEIAPRHDFVQRHCERYTSLPWTDVLPFADDTFDLVVTQDLFEHLFEPAAAASEITRVVRPGGAHVFTAPKHKGLRATRQRARREAGSVVHLLPAEYHGDPLSDDRELVTWDYGEDFEAHLGAWCGHPSITYIVRDRSLGLDGEYLEVFVTRRSARHFAQASTELDKCPLGP